MPQTFYKKVNQRFTRLNEKFVPHTVKWRADMVGITVHSMMMYNPTGEGTLMYGVRISPEHFWALYDFSHVTPTKAIFKDENGKEWETYCGVVSFKDNEDFRFCTRELRIGANYKYGPTVATCVRQAEWVDTSQTLTKIEI